MIPRKYRVVPSLYVDYDSLLQLFYNLFQQNYFKIIIVNVVLKLGTHLG